MKNHKQANLTIHGQQADRSRPSRRGRRDRDPDPDWGRRVSGDSPGAVILLAALLVSLPPRRWAPIVGVSLAILILVGAFVTPSMGNRLSEPGEIGPFIGRSVQMLGLITAVVTGIVATVQNFRTPYARRSVVRRAFSGS